MRLGATILAVMLAFPCAAAAQRYPVKPVRVIVPSQPGGGADLVLRLIGPMLTETWGQQVVIDNRIGVAGAEIARNAAGDGYTLMFSTSALAIRESVYRKLSYRTLRDFEPVTQAVAQSNVLLVNPTVPAKSVRELIALAKARPGELNYASSGSGTSNHLAAELFRLLAGIRVVHVPYRGGPAALIDCMSGRVQFVVTGPVPALPHVKEGRLRLLAVTTASRFPGLPDVPTVAESGLPGYDFTGWMGLLTPLGVPNAIIAKLRADMTAVLQRPLVRQRLLNDAAVPVGSSPAQFQAFLKSEIEKWTRVAREAGVEAD